MKPTPNAAPETSAAALENASLKSSCRPSSARPGTIRPWEIACDRSIVGSTGGSPPISAACGRPNPYLAEPLSVRSANPLLPKASTRNFLNSSSKSKCLPNSLLAKNLISPAKSSAPGRPISPPARPNISKYLIFPGECIVNQSIFCLNMKKANRALLGPCRMNRGRANEE